MQKHYADQPERREAQGLAADWDFATKPQPAKKIVARTLAAGPLAWVAGDEVYGRDPDLRLYLETQGLGYVLAVGVDFTVSTPTGPMRADAVVELIPADAWERRSCGTGSKGQRLYDWAFFATSEANRVLLIRRALTPNAKGVLELAFFYCHAPAGRRVAMPDLIKIAGIRCQRNRQPVG